MPAAHKNSKAVGHQKTGGFASKTMRCRRNPRKHIVSGVESGAFQSEPHSSRNQSQ